MVFETLSPKLQNLVKEKGLIEPTLPQKLGIPIIRDGENVLVIAPTGIGKCVSGDTVIFTENGPEEIQNLYMKEINTNSLDENLKVNLRPAAVIRKRKSKLYLLKTCTGRSIKVTDDHKFLTIENGMLLWRELKNLKVENYIACSKKLSIKEREVFITLDTLKDHSNEITVKTEPSVKELYLKSKLKTKLVTRKLASLLGCHRVTLTTSIKGRFLGANTVIKLAELASVSSNEIKVTEISAAAARPLKIKINEDFAYFAGIFAGDGNFNQGRTLRICTSSDNILKFIKTYCKILGFKLCKDNTHKYDYYFSSKALYVLLNSLGLPDKNKSGNIRIPKIFYGDKKLLASFLRGLFDTDGSVYGNTIEFVSKSRKLVEDISTALLCFGIFSRVKEKEIKGYGKYYRIFIQDNKNLNLFLTNIGFEELKKINRLKNLSNKKYNPNLDVIPHIGNSIKNCKIKMNIPYSRSLTTYRTYESYAYNQRNPSPSGLTTVLNMFESMSKEKPEDLYFLQNLANSDIFWDKIKSIGFFGEDYVYDATVPETHNFIGNGIILHNTETAMLPLLDKTYRDKLKPISLLYITPLKSLNRDLLDRLFWWGDKLDIEIAVRHGDTDQKERASQREAPPQCLITTPETLQAILTGKIFREHLKNVKCVVIDEIHELVESKRGVQLSLGLERLKQLAGNFQRIGLSATVGSPEIVAEYLGEKVKIIRAESQKRYDIRVETPRPEAKDQDIADDLVIGISTTARLRRLYELIKSHKSVIAFTNTRETAEVISSRLAKLDRELKQAVHHGSLSKERRVKSEVEFKGQKLKSLIATSSLELGIDIGSIDLVVQYLSPRQAARLIQRVGRAGHRIDEVSKGVILSGEEDVFESAVIAENAEKKKLEKIKMHEMAMDVLAGQILGMAIDEYDLTSDKIYEITKGSYLYRTIKKEDIESLLKFMESIRLIFLNPPKSPKENYFMIKRRRKSWTSYFENLSTIPAAVKFRVISIVQNEPIGSLDEAFIAEHGQSGNKFICAGRAWKIIQVDGNKVIVEPVDDIESAIPSWEGELIPVAFEVAQEVGKLRKIAATENVAKIKEFYKVDNETAKEMVDIIKKHKPFIVPDDKNFLVETYKDFVIIHSCCGSLVNDTIGRYLSAVITNETGVAVNMKNDPYRIILQTVATPDKIKNALEDSEDMETVLATALERSTMFKWRFLHVARRFGVISKDARYDKINMNKIVQSYAKTPIYKETLREIFLEKMDVGNAKLVIDKIRKEEIKLHIKQGLSYLGEIGLTHQFSEVMKPRMPEKEIFLAFRKRLLATRVRLLCTNCGEYNLVQTVKDVEDQPECPKCSSRLIAVIRKGQIKAFEIVKKRAKKKPLTDDEQRELQTIRRSADLVMVYGRKAVEVLAGHGIGPQTAARILAMMHTNKEKFYRDILAAEKQFVRTKIYWK